jgi:hypothetical protein
MGLIIFIPISCVIIISIINLSITINIQDLYNFIKNISSINNTSNVLNNTTIVLNNTIPKNKNHKYLCYTNLLLIVTIIYFLFYEKKVKHKPFIEYVLAGFLIPVIITAQLFWNNPIKYSRIHKIDAIFAKIGISTLLLYTLLYKFHFSCLFIILPGSLSVYLSNYYSKKEWCSNKHIFFHGLLHVCCFLTTLYTFYPILL